MTIVLADYYDERRVIDLEKQKWLHEVLVALGASADVVETGGMEARDHIAMLELEVWEDVEGSINILRSGKLVAQWKVPRLVIVKEAPEKWYYEIHLNEWALPFQAKGGR